MAQAVMPKLFSSLGERFDLNGAVEKAVVGMEMKVCEFLILHKQ